MDLLCEVCDRSIIENEPKYYNYLITLGRKNHKSFYNNYTISSVNLDEVIQILSNYISTRNKNFDFYFIFKCEFVIKFW